MQYESTHILPKRDEGDIEDEHARPTNVVLDDVPSVVFAANLISALAPVVEGQASTPDD